MYQLLTLALRQSQTTHLLFDDRRSDFGAIDRDRNQPGFRGQLQPEILGLSHWHFELRKVRATAIRVDNGQVLRPFQSNAVKLLRVIPRALRRGHGAVAKVSPLNRYTFLARRANVVSGRFTRSGFRPKAAGKHFKVGPWRFEAHVARGLQQDWNLRPLLSLSIQNRNSIRKMQSCFTRALREQAQAI